MLSKIQKNLSIFVILIGVFFLTNLLIDNPITHRLVGAAINEKISNKLNIKLKFQAMEVTLIPLGVEFYGFKIINENTPQISLLSAAHIKARLSTFSLITGRPRISLVEANELKVEWPLPISLHELVHDKSIFSAHENSLKNEWPPLPDFPLDRIVLINSNINSTIMDPKAKDKKTQVFMSGIDLDFQKNSWDNLDADLKIQSIDLSIDDRIYLKNAKLAFEADLDDTNFKSQKIEIEHNGSPITLLEIDTSDGAAKLSTMMLRTGFSGWLSDNMSRILQGIMKKSLGWPTNIFMEKLDEPDFSGIPHPKSKHSGRLKPEEISPWAQRFVNWMSR